MQERRYSSALAIELHLSYTNPTICTGLIIGYRPLQVSGSHKQGNSFLGLAVTKKCYLCWKCITGGN